MSGLRGKGGGGVAAEGGGIWTNPFGRWCKDPGTAGLGPCTECETQVPGPRAKPPTVTTTPPPLPRPTPQSMNGVESSIAEMDVKMQRLREEREGLSRRLGALNDDIGTAEKKIEAASEARVQHELDAMVRGGMGRGREGVAAADAMRGRVNAASGCGCSGPSDLRLPGDACMARPMPHPPAGGHARAGRVQGAAQGDQAHVQSRQPAFCPLLPVKQALIRQPLPMPRGAAALLPALCCGPDASHQPTWATRVCPLEEGAGESCLGR